MKRGGDRGGGTTVRDVKLSELAAAELRRRANPLGTRYRKAEADAAASALLEALASGTAIVLPTAAIAPALVWLEEARAACFSEDGQRALDHLIAAIRSATIGKH